MTDKKKKSKKETKKFDSYGILSTLIMIFVLSIIILSIVLKDSDEEKYKIIRNSARVFGQNMNIYMGRNTDVVEMSLKEAVDKKIVSKFKNPFVGDTYCDLYDSKVSSVKDRRYVTLRCGGYMIFNQYVGSNEYKIYKIGKWSQDKKTTTDIVKIGYNYTEDGKKVFDDYYNEKTFLYMYNTKNNTKYKSILEMNEVPIDKKTFYAALEIIK